MSQMQQLSEQLTRISSLSFEEARNHAALVGLAVLPTALVASTIDYFRHPEAKQPGIEGADPVLIEEVREVKGNHLKAHRRRWALPLAAVAGVSLMAPNYMKPMVTVDEVDAGSATMLVIDQSYPMLFTNDMDGSVSRASAVNAAVANATNKLPNQIKIGAVTYAATNEVPALAKLGTDRGSLIAGITGSKVDPNGLNASDALVTAQNVFAGNTDVTTKNIVIVTDGLVSDPEAVKTGLTQAVKEGEKVTVIITGTKEGGYKRTTFDQHETPAGATAVAYSGIEGVTVVTAESTEQVTNQLHDTIKSSAIKSERKPFKLFLKAGEALEGLVLLGLISKALRRKN